MSLRKSMDAAYAQGQQDGTRDRPPNPVRWEVNDRQLRMAYTAGFADARRDATPDIPTARLKKRVIIKTKSGDGFRGIWWERDNEAIVLRDAEHIQPATDKQFVPADGEIVVLVAEVAYIQIL